MIWRYQAKNLAQKKITGLIEAKDPAEVYRILMAQNYYLLLCRRIRKKIIEESYKKPLSARLCANFCRQFAALIQAGVGIPQSLMAIRDYSNNKSLQNVITLLTLELSKGHTLADSFQKFSTFFTPFFVQMIKIGEVSGQLAFILQRLAAYFETTSQLQRKVRQSFQYPKMLVLLCLLVILVMSFFVVPIFINIFKRLESEIPTSILVIIAIKSFLSANWRYFFVIFLLLILIFKRMAKSKWWKLLIDQISLFIPLYRSFLVASISSKFTRSFGILYRSGVSILESINNIIPLLNNKILERRLHSAFTHFQTGISLYQALKEIRLFPPDLLEMIHVGEQSGDLDELLMNSTDYFDEQVMSKAQALVAIIEPCLIILVAILIFGIMITIFIPLLRMINIKR